MVEQGTLKSLVVGSSPTVRVIYFQEDAQQ